MAVTAVPWEEADGLFRGDARWRGSDDAYSVPLDGDRTLWLFGDTFVGPPGAGTRVGSRIVRNSVAVQTGRDPLTATMEFAWRGTDDEPLPYFPGDGEGTPAEWLWPVHGVCSEGRLLLFLMALDLPPGGDPDDPLGMSFRVNGWRAFVVDDVSGPAAGWSLRPLPDRPETLGAVPGTALLAEDGVLYLWAHRAGIAELARVPLAAAVRGDLSALEWWAGGDAWTADVRRAAVAVMPAGTEFTIHRLADGRLCLVDVHPLIGPTAGLHVRFADRVEGPWTERERVYLIPEGARADAFVYAGKAHPEQAAGGLAVTYASNGTDLAKLYSDESLYYPRFVRLAL